MADIPSDDSQSIPPGRLKIFLGYAAGVGKTYAMAEAARQRISEGADVVVGWIETHGSSEADTLLEAMESIPLYEVDDRGKKVYEMDLDAILRRRPFLVLVDDLAHTNVNGSRHPKRYQDVEELLQAGINVYTTLNIQHLESLNDVVAQITGVRILETVPDRILDMAARLELIDLPTDELMQRLQDGKVYIPDRAAFAMQKFFRQGNLTALRELALRRVARRVDDQMYAYMQTRAIPGPWPAGERLLICVSPSPMSERLIRTGRRLADQLNAEWFAVYVEPPRVVQESDRDRVAQHLRLAEELGAKTSVISGDSVANAVLEYARDHNVTKIIVGKPIRPAWAELLQSSMVDQLVRHSGSIDIYIINSKLETPQPPALRPIRHVINYWRYFKVLGVIAFTSLWGFAIDPFISPTNLVMFYLLAVVIAALRWGRGPATFTAVLSVITFDVLFIAPAIPSVPELEFLVTFVAFMSVGFLIATLTARAREHAEAARRREAQTAALYALSSDLATATTTRQVAQAVVDHVSHTFNAQAGVLLPENDILMPCCTTANFVIGQEEVGVAVWAFQHGQHAGHNTDTLPTARARYLPLKTAKAVVGVLGVFLEPSVSPERRRLLEAFASQGALAIEAIRQAEQAREAQLLREKEKLQSALLNSISHDLRTPLVSVTGALSSLKDDSGLLDKKAQRELVETALEEANRLNWLVGNLLDMTRLESNALYLKKEPCDVQDIIGVALSQMRERLRSRETQLDIPPDLPLMSADFVLIVQVLVNLLDNAVKYTPAWEPIEVCARQHGEMVEIEVADHGKGIPPSAFEHIFEKFYRVNDLPEDASGTGLGLSIVKGIVEAHKGIIEVQNRPGGGASFRFSVPIHRTERITA